MVRFLIKVIRFCNVQLVTYYKWCLMKIAKNWVVLNRISVRVRPWIWKRAGCQIRGKISIGYDVYFDATNSHLICIEEGVWIASRALLLCHKRDLSSYSKGSDYNELGYHKMGIHLKRGSVIGMGAIILPGVTIGEGSIVGAGSVVSRDVPDWTIVTGNPAKVVKQID